MYNISFLSFYYIVHSYFLINIYYYLLAETKKNYFATIIAICRFAKPPWKNTTKKHMDCYRT